MLQRLWSAIDAVLVAAAGLILVAGILHVTADVAMKYLFASPIPGTIVYVSNYYMTSIVFLPLVSAELRRQHIAVDLWPSSTPAWLDRLGERITWGISAAVYALLTWNTWQDAYRKFEEGEYVLDQSGFVTTWPSYFILPLGMALMTGLLLTKLWRPALALRGDEVEANV
ncbi:TRAP transporter small permease [Aquibium sp. LZ166]|uniref:TRAP transporter small permease protein n=1 Tax=Aquibium pacificus TaxID=3153579 RepID=A0ABV3SIS8_9HYPH